MIGNDINEDILPTQSLGIASFLLTDCVIWEKDKESVIPGGYRQEIMQNCWSF